MASTTRGSHGVGRGVIEVNRQLEHESFYASGGPHHGPG